MSTQTATKKTSKDRSQARRRFTLDRVKTPIGLALVVVDEEERLRAFDWEEYASREQRLLRLYYGDGVTAVTGRAPAALRHRIEAYFDGECDKLEGIACETAGTAFQRAVWAGLRQIPVGETMSYGGLAAAIGSPKACRAVGMANGSNPIGLVVPCHRVIGSNGSLTGYGGGMERKRWLLEHERKFVARTGTA